MGANPVDSSVHIKTYKMTKIFCKYSKKYFYKYFTKLKYSHFYGKEILKIPKTIAFKKIVETPKFQLFDNLKQQIFNTNHTFTKKELCLILEKYFYCIRILDIAPLTKYLYLNFKYLKHTNTNYYKIKVNYIFATPKLANYDCLLKLQLHFSQLKTKKFVTGYKLLNGRHIINQLFLTATIKHVKHLKPITLNKFLHIYNNKRIQSSYNFYNLMKCTNSDTHTLNPIEVLSYNEKQPISQSLFTGSGCTHDINKVLFTYPHTEPTKVNIQFHCAIPFKILTLNLFKYFKISNDLDFFYFLIYNYCILKNIYFSENKKIIQIIQKHSSTEAVISTLKHFGNKKDSDIYESLLINNVPIIEIELGDICWFIKNIYSIAETMSNVLDVYTTKEEILSKLHKILKQHTCSALTQLLKISKFITKQELLIEKEYHISKTYINWHTIMVLYILKFNGIRPPEEIRFVQTCVEDLDELLIYTNIFTEQTTIYADSREQLDEF